MMKIAQLPLIVLLSVLAMGCTSDEEDELLVVVYDEEVHEDGVVDPSSKYAFTLERSEKYITLKGDLGKIVIVGDGNNVTIEEDAEIEELNITGSGNTVMQAGDLSVVIETITINGNDSFIIISEYYTLNVHGENNQIGQTLSGEISDL